MENQKEEKESEIGVLKTAKGTRDFHPEQMLIREEVMKKIRSVFKKHGGVEIDTPVFELSEILKGKYGESSKLIYELQDQGGELLSLRYDLTVPFARYLASYNLKKMKRFHIAKVYRRDNPAMTKGRFREFFQCDFDIAGKYDCMLPDAEVIKVIDEILNEIDVGKYQIKINHRELLDAILEISKAPLHKSKQIFSSIDKLDKLPWEKVRIELIEERQLSEDVVDIIEKFVNLKGKPLDLLLKLQQDKYFDSSVKGKKALEEMTILFQYLEDMDCLDNILLDLSLARGLDYYTGMILEAVMVEKDLGSVAGGGRYDDLVGMFSNEKIPAVGASVGIERLFSLIEKKFKDNHQTKYNDTEIVVATIGTGMDHEKLKIISGLWKAGIKAEFFYYKEAKPLKQITEALEKEIPFILWIGENEIKSNSFKIKSLYVKEEETVSRDQLVDHLKKKIEVYKKDLADGKIVFEKKEEKK